MSVRLNYYGSTFELDPRQPDDYWVELLEEAVDNNHDRRGTLSVTLVDGHQVWIPIWPGVPLAYSYPREDHVGESTAGGVVFWADGTNTDGVDLN